MCSDPIDAIGDERIGIRDVDTLVARLVDKSLVIADHTESGVRFRMLQTLADYAAEQLIASGEAEQVGHRHARYFAGLVAPVELGLLGREQRRWMQWLRVEWANITTAMDHALAVDDADTAIQLVAPLGWYFFMIDETAAGVEWLHAALACSGRSDPRLRSLALGSYAFLASTGPDPVNAAVVAERALATLDSYDDPATEAIVTGMYLMCQLFRGHIEACRAVFPLTEAAALRSGNRWSVAMATLVGAEITGLLGQPHEAESEMRRAADGFAAVGDRFCYSICVAHAAELAEVRGDYDPAIRMLEESLALAEDVGFSVRGLATRSRLANLEILRGNLALAESMHRQALESGSGPIPQWMHAITHARAGQHRPSSQRSRRSHAVHRRGDGIAAIVADPADAHVAAGRTRLQRRSRRRRRGCPGRPVRRPHRRALRQCDQEHRQCGRRAGGGTGPPWRG